MPDAPTPRSEPEPRPGASEPSHDADAHPRAHDDVDDEDDRPSPFGWFPILILIVLVVGGLFVMFELRDVSNIQDCVQSGRKNCAPIDTTNMK
jgi:hypothetical protein